MFTRSLFIISDTLKYGLRLSYSKYCKNMIMKKKKLNISNSGYIKDSFVFSNLIYFLTYHLMIVTLIRIHVNRFYDINCCFNAM